MGGQIGCLALDGEREFELTPDDRIVASLRTGELATIDVDAVMRAAASAGVMTGPAQPSAWRA
jgi:hypothetical protein